MTNRFFGGTGVSLTVLSMALTCCGGSGPSTPTPPSNVTTTTSTTAPPQSAFEMKTLVTVYKRADAFAEFTVGTTRDERLQDIMLGAGVRTAGTTLLNNEVGRVTLNSTITRVNEEFTDEDFVSVFDETKANLRRFFNDADNDGWAVDGRHGEGRDWPHDGDGNDPDGWTAQIVIDLVRVQ